MYFKYVFQLLVFQLLHNTVGETILTGEDEDGGPQGELGVSKSQQGRRQGFRPGWAKSTRSAENFCSFAHPGFQFAHPVIRNGCPPCPPYRGGFKGKGLVGH